MDYSKKTQVLRLVSGQCLIGCDRNITNKRNIRTEPWYEEVAECFDINERLLKTAMSPTQLEPRKEPLELKEARETIRKTFMPQASIQLQDRILNGHSGSLLTLSGLARGRITYFVYKSHLKTKC
jgi:hypothetical protein